MKNKLQILTDRINELVPENTRVKFGTKIKYQDREDQTRTGIVWREDLYTYNAEGYSVTDNFQSSSKPLFLERDSDWEILGNPITLETVLMAMQNPETTANVYIRGDGTFFKWKEFAEGNGNHQVNSTWVTWQLGKTLDQQSEELWDLLIEIVCNQS